MYHLHKSVLIVHLLIHKCSLFSSKDFPRMCGVNGGKTGDMWDKWGIIAIRICWSMLRFDDTSNNYAMIFKAVLAEKKNDVRVSPKHLQWYQICQEVFTVQKKFQFCVWNSDNVLYIFFIYNMIFNTRVTVIRQSHITIFNIYVTFSTKSQFQKNVSNHLSRKKRFRWQSYDITTYANLPQNQPYSIYYASAGTKNWTSQALFHVHAKRQTSGLEKH